MTNEVTLFEGAQLPAAFQTDANEVANDLSEGVLAGFPIISYRGKVWRFKKGDEEVKLEDPKTGDPLASIPVILIAANNKLSKIFYEGTYEEGSAEKPRCFSVDGIRPDKSIEAPINPTCENCPNNAWGSAISPNGAKIKACADNRRVALAFPEELKEKGDKANIFLLRIPGASLSNLKVYGEKVLGEKGWPYYAVVTRIGFDSDASYPKLTFRPERPVPAELANLILNLRDSELARTIVSAGGEMAKPPKEPAPEPRATVTPITPEPVALVEKSPSQAKTKQQATSEQPAEPTLDGDTDAALKSLLGGLNEDGGAG